MVEWWTLKTHHTDGGAKQYAAAKA